MKLPRLRGLILGAGCMVRVEECWNARPGRVHTGSGCLAQQPQALGIMDSLQERIGSSGGGGESGGILGGSSSGANQGRDLRGQGPTSPTHTLDLGNGGGLPTPPLQGQLPAHPHPNQGRGLGSSMPPHKGTPPRHVRGPVIMLWNRLPSPPGEQEGLSLVSFLFIT